MQMNIPHVCMLVEEIRTGKKYRQAFTGMMDFGRIDNQTNPVKTLVTAKPSVNRSALDCELIEKTTII